MSLKHEKDKLKSMQDKLQKILYDLLRDEDNKYCVDCDAKGPRWASWNLGIFLCIRCAGIHRNLGVHLSKVKSVNLDSWTEDQVARVQQMGNSKARAVYEAQVPDHFRRPQTDSALESFIRAKYEHKKYIAREWVPPKPKSIVYPTSSTSDIAAKTSKGREAAKPATPMQVSKETNHTKKASMPPSSVASPVVAPLKDSGQMDLLGLDDPAQLPSTSTNLSKDIFGDFLSHQAPVDPAMTSSTTTIATTSSLNNTDLFNPTTVANDTLTVTKDSILALYGNQKNPISAPQLFAGGNQMQDQSLFNQALHPYMLQAQASNLPQMQQQMLTMNLNPLQQQQHQSGLIFHQQQFPQQFQQQQPSQQFPQQFQQQQPSQQFNQLLQPQQNNTIFSQQLNSLYHQPPQPQLQQLPQQLPPQPQLQQLPQQSQLQQLPQQLPQQHQLQQQPQHQQQSVKAPPLFNQPTHLTSLPLNQPTTLLSGNIWQ